MTNTTSDVILDPFYIDVYEWTKHAVCGFMGISFLLGIPGNTVVVIVHYRIQEKTVTDWMIFYIAACDIMSLTNVPMYITQFEGFWPLGFPRFLCKYHYFSVNSSSMASYLFCACTAVERYYKVVYSKEIFSLTVVRLLWIPVFLISFAIGSIVVFAVDHNPNGHCMYDLKVRYLSTIEYACLLFVAFVSSMIMSFCYIRTGLFLKKKMKERVKYGVNSGFSKSYQSTIQTTKMLAIVTIIFMFSANVPYISGVMFSSRRPSTEPAMSILISLALAFFINNFCNPFLYMSMSASFRKRTHALFKSCCIFI